MKRPLPVLPVLASQCYSHGVDVDLDTRHGTSGSREPLKESSGNAQHNQLVRSSSYDHRSEHHQHVYPIPPSLYLGQTLDFTTYGGAHYAESLLRQPQVQLHNAQGGRRGLGGNPFWQSLEFQAYRKRQAERESQGQQKWPEATEKAFLDAFLLIPQIGKMKYSLRGILHGRNMLISEYIWLDYVANLPPGVQPDESERKGRKQVSSHIQVLKNFLNKHPYFHIFFPSYDSRNADKDRDRENQQKESLKHHPVLIALTEQRLPDERPNYEYFSQILAMRNPMAIKPRRCWVFVSHRDVGVHEDGSGYLVTTGDRLAKGEFPHLRLNLEREKWSKEEQKEVKGVLLHEFTKDLSQFESSTIREITDLWEDTCTELHEKLEDIVETNPRCDILHMHSILELKEKCRFPSHSDLNSWVEITIEQPHLLNHRWKVETTLVRPPELSYSSEKSAPETMYQTSAKMSIQVEHRPGCDGHCGSGGKARDGISRFRKDYVIVPFPADVFALTLTNCAEYPAHPPLDLIRRGPKATKVVEVDEDDQDVDLKEAASSGDQPTQMDLVPKIHMMQELWSCPPEDPYGDDSQGAGGKNNKKGPRWERRGLILWTFQTIHSLEIKGDKIPELKTAPNGKTQWRFLQILDTASEYHQSRILVRGDGSRLGKYRDGGYSGRTGSFNPSVKLEQPIKHESWAPSPLSMAYKQHQPRSASASDTFSATGWDLHGAGSLNSLPSSATQARAQAAYNTQLMLQTNHTGGMLDAFGGGSGLATPPPSASLASSFATSFETASNDTADHITNYMASQVTSVDIAHSQQTTLGDLSAVTDPFLANSAASSFDTTAAFDEPVSAHDDVSRWGTSGSTVPGANGGWSTGYSSTTPTTNGNHHHPGANVMHWGHGSPSAAGSNSIGRHYSQHTTTQPPQLHLQTQGHHHGHHHPHHWGTGTTDPEETGFWTPATSTDDGLTSGIDARKQVIWPVSTQGIPNTTNDWRSAGDDWVHVQHRQQQQDLPEEISGPEGAGGQRDEEEILSASTELSQGWEEIVASAAAAAAESQQSQSRSQSQSQSQSQFDTQGTSTTTEDDLLHASFPLSPFAAVGNHLLDMSDSNTFTTTQQQQQQHHHRGQKRSRSDSTSHGSGGYYDNEFGVPVAHHLHRSSQRTRLSPSQEAC